MLGNKCWWRKARQLWKQGNIAESHAGGGAITTVSLSPHASISRWTIERLAHHTPDALIYGAGPQPGGPPLCAWCAKQQRRTPGQGASKCLNYRATKTGQRGLLIASRKRLGKKDCDRAITPAGGSPCPCPLGASRVPKSQAAAPPSRSVLTGAGRSQAKKALPPCTQGHFGHARLCDPVDCGLPGLSVREVGSSGKNTGAYGPILVAMAFYISGCPSRQPPWVPGAARTPATQAAAPPPHLASRGRPKSCRAASGANPSGRPTRRGGNRTTAETQGQRG